MPRSTAGGTLAHHHGVGRSKAPRLGDELGRGLDVQRAFKRAFDPHGVLNPGALLPPISPNPFSRDVHASRTFDVDRESLLVHVDARRALRATSRRARARGLTLDVRGSAFEGTHRRVARVRRARRAQRVARSRRPPRRGIFGAHRATGEGLSRFSLRHVARPAPISSRSSLARVGRLLALESRVAPRASRRRRASEPPRSTTTRRAARRRRARTLRRDRKSIHLNARRALLHERCQARARRRVQHRRKEALPCKPHCGCSGRVPHVCVSSEACASR